MVVLDSSQVHLVQQACKGKTLVTTCGCFDLLHTGHLHSLVQAKSAGDLLLVLLNSDTSVRSIKGPKRPINPQDERAVMVDALRPVDFVIIFDEPTPLALLELIRPDVHVKSRSSYKGIEGPVIEKYGGRIVLIDDVPGKSSTRIIDRL